MQFCAVNFVSLKKKTVMVEIKSISIGQFSITDQYHRSVAIIFFQDLVDFKIQI